MLHVRVGALRVGGRGGSRPPSNEDAVEETAAEAETEDDVNDDGGGDDEAQKNLKDGLQRRLAYDDVLVARVGRAIVAC